MTYCDIGVNFVLLSIFTDEPATQLVDTRGHYLKPLMALWEDGLESFYLLLEGVQASHLRCNRGVIENGLTAVLWPKKHCGQENTMYRLLPEKMATSRLTNSWDVVNFRYFSFSGGATLRPRAASRYALSANRIFTPEEYSELERTAYDGWHWQRVLSNRIQREWNTQKKFQYFFNAMLKTIKTTKFIMFFSILKIGDPRGEAMRCEIYELNTTPDRWSGRSTFDRIKIRTNMRYLREIYSRFEISRRYFHR